MVRVSGKIRRLLVDEGAVSNEDWTTARESGQPVVDSLLEQGVLTERPRLRVSLRHQRKAEHVNGRSRLALVLVAHYFRFASDVASCK